MIFEKNTKIDFDVDDFIKSLNIYFYSDNRLYCELKEYISYKIENNNEKKYYLLNDDDINQILQEVKKELKNKMLTLEEKEQLKDKIKNYYNRIQFFQKEIEKIEEILSKNG